MFFFNFGRSQQEENGPLGPLFAININDCQINKIKDRSSFSVISIFSTFTFVAANHQERQKWTNALEKAQKDVENAFHHHQERHPFTRSSSSYEDSESRNEAFKGPLTKISLKEENMVIAENREAKNKIDINCQNYILNNLNRIELRNETNRKRLKKDK